MNALTSLAILKVDIDEGSRDYIDYLMLFVVEALAIHRPERVDDTVVVQLLENEFGIRIPVKAVQFVLRRLVKKHDYLHQQDGAYFISPSLPKPSMGPRRAAAEGQIDNVISELCKFTREIGAEHPWQPEQAIEALMSFLKQFGIDCLRCYVFNTVLPDVKAPTAQEHYVVGRFIKEAAEQNRGLFDRIIVIVKGQMYSNALTCPDLQSLQQHFNTLTCYLDTPVILNLLGLHGDENESAANELVELIRNVGGSVGVFHHTLQETASVIQFAIDHYQNLSVTNRALRELRATNTPISDLILLKGNLEDKLLNKRVRVYDTPPYTTEFQIDEEVFGEALDDEIHYMGAQALANDVNSVRSIYVKRHGTTPVRLEDAVAVFVTSNAKFSKVAYEQGKSHNSSREVSPVITDYSLANVAWLKAPLKQPNLPERETLALCYAALEPSKSLVEKYVRVMDELREHGSISEKDHAILRASPLAERELMGMTLGDDDALSHRGVVEILEIAKEELLSEANEKHEAVVKQMKEEHSHLAENATKANIEAHKARSSYEALYNRANSRAERWANKVINILLFVISLILLFGGFVAGGIMSPPKANGIERYTFLALAILAIVWGWWNWLHGKSLREILRRPRDRIKRIFMKFLFPDDAT